jgi:hypothetical protein
MLSKLIKYELKATGRLFLPLFLALLLFAVINRFTPEKFGDTPAEISIIICIMIMVGMFVMTFIMMIQRFKNNLLSDEGYLMHSLPVKPWKHILSKLLVSMLWIVVSGFTAFISILIIALNGDLTELTEFFAEFYQQVYGYLGTSVYLLSFELILVLLISLASGIFLIYTSIALGHLFNKHKMLASFGAFIVLSTIPQFFFSLIGVIPGIPYFSTLHISSADELINNLPVIQLMIVSGIIFTALLSVAYFAITNYILSKRLNLE